MVMVMMMEKYMAMVVMVMNKEIVMIVMVMVRCEADETPGTCSPATGR